MATINTCAWLAAAAVICLLASQTSALPSDSLRVRLADGSPLLGRYLTSHGGRGIRAFLGVPYAQPPVNELRFRSPVPVRPWTTELPTIADPPVCIQRDPFRRDQTLVGTEDCLYLNVYAPLDHSTVHGPLPVMVFFHGGGFMCGSGISAFYGPDFLLDHDVIFVGVNYRLGPLGFLSTGDARAPGNFGLKDQQLALHWVQANVAQFGGDPRLVTIFGESAGGASVTYHMQAPRSQGLFARAISQSGTNLAPWSQPAHPGVAAQRAAKLSAIVGCKTEAGSEMVECLRGVSAADLTAAFYAFFEWDYDPMVPFPPVVEPVGEDAFISEHPRNVARPHGSSIPWMTGLTTDEGALKTAAVINLPEVYADFNANFGRALPIALNYDHHAESVQVDITERISKRYFNDRRLVNETHQGFTDLFSDGWFGAAMDEYLEKRLAQGDAAAPTYVYLFAHRGQASFTEIFHGRDTDYGVCHADDLQYLFPIGSGLFPTAAPTKADTLMRQTMVALWVNFARTGRPTVADGANAALPLDVPDWKTCTQFPLNYLRIGNRYETDRQLLDMEVGLLDDRLGWWRELRAHGPARDADHDRTEL